MVLLFVRAEVECGNGLLGSLSNVDDDAWKKIEFTFYKRNSRLPRLVRFANGSKNVLKLNMQRRPSIRNGNKKN